MKAPGRRWSINSILTDYSMMTDWTPYLQLSMKLKRSRSRVKVRSVNAERQNRGTALALLAVSLFDWLRRSALAFLEGYAPMPKACVQLWGVSQDVALAPAEHIHGRRQPEKGFAREVTGN